VSLANGGYLTILFNAWIIHENISHSNWIINHFLFFITQWAVKSWRIRIRIVISLTIKMDIWSGISSKVWLRWRKHQIYLRQSLKYQVFIRHVIMIRTYLLNVALNFKLESIYILFKGWDLSSQQLYAHQNLIFSSLEANHYEHPHLNINCSPNLKQL
jgi:hypothetical protein